VTENRRNLAIFWISLLGLYLELLLIRWIGTEIRIFAYLQNTVLVVCFLGLGIGLFTSRSKISAQRGLFAIFLLAVALAWPASRDALAQTSQYLSVLGEINIWGSGIAETSREAIKYLFLGLLLTFAVMVLILEPFVPIGRYLGRLLNNHPRPIVAYSFNVAGSLGGIWLFAGLSRISQAVQRLDRSRAPVSDDSADLVAAESERCPRDGVVPLPEAGAVSARRSGGWHCIGSQIPRKREQRRLPSHARFRCHRQRSRAL
jgi:hypothetical protein